MSATFDIGDVARTFCRFFRKPDVGQQQLMDPTVITCTVTNPQNVDRVYTFQVDPELVRISNGFFKVEEPCTIAGEWKAVWQGTGAVAAVDGAQWVVKAP